MESKKMIKGITAFLIITLFSNIRLQGQDYQVPDTVSMQSGHLTLKALLWRPPGNGPFATIIFCHGSYPSSDTTHDPIQEISIPGPLFAHKGYIYLALFRRGVGLSKMQGLNGADLMENAFKLNGQEGRNEEQMKQLETVQLQDMMAGLDNLRKRPDVDERRIAIVGHSFGGSLSLLVAEFDGGLKAVVVFSAGGYSWNLSPRLRARLITAVKKIKAPVMMIHARNDYSTSPGYMLDSIMNHPYKPHILVIYPKFRNTANEAHNFIFLGTQTWEADVFEFLEKNL
jgi:dipeptidyl aminopeptidase/acylaminoacyl peptidase